MYPSDIQKIPYPQKTMYQFIYDNNINRLDNYAMVYFDKKITYREMFSNINIVVRSFVEQGVKAGDIVSIISLNTPETLYCIYALNMIGAIANLMIATITVEEINEQLEKTHSKFLFIFDKIHEKIGQIDCKIPLVELSLAESAGGLNKILLKLTGKTSKESISYKSFISNSTKTSDVKVSGKNYKEYETFLNILPPFFSFGISMLYVCLYSGMAEIICIVPKVENIRVMIYPHSLT